MNRETLLSLSAGWPVLLCTGFLLGYIALRAAERRAHLLWYFPVLLVAAPLFGDLVRDVTPAIVAIFSFQVLVVVAFGFVLWFWTLRIYPASDMTSFGFLAPLFGVLGGWLILDEAITVSIIGALVLVGAGIALVSWRPRVKAPAIRHAGTDAGIFRVRS